MSEVLLWAGRGGRGIFVFLMLLYILHVLVLEMS